MASRRNPAWLTAQYVAAAIMEEDEDSDSTDSIHNEEITDASYSCSESDEEAPIPQRMRSTDGDRNQPLTQRNSSPHIQRRNLVDKNVAF